MASGADTQKNKVYAVWVKNPGALTVTKQTAGDGVPTDATYDYVLNKVNTTTNDDGTTTTTYTPVSGAKYTIGSGTEQTTDTDGKFSLKAGETATFSSLDPVSYQVVETKKATDTFSTTWSANSAGTDTTGTGLEAIVSVGTGVTSTVKFTNTYGVSLEMDLEKYVKSTTGESYSFTTSPSFKFDIAGEAVTPADATFACPMPTVTSKTIGSIATVPVDYADISSPAGKADFGNPISVTFTHAGTYKYTFTETNPSANWAIDGASAHVLSVVVAPNASTGALEISSATWDNTSDVYVAATSTVNAKATVRFYNKYTPTPVTYDGTVINKTVVGSGFGTQTFDFTIEPKDDASKQAHDSGTGTAVFSDAGTQQVDFGTFTFTKSGTYTYTVKETAPSPYPDGWQLDTAEHEFTITVTAGDNGTLTASTPTIVALTNTYGTTSATVTKKWDDSDNKYNRRTDVTFQLMQSIDGAEATAVAGKTVTIGVDSTSNEQTATISNLPSYIGGKAVVYSFKETTANS